MDLGLFERAGEYEFRVAPTGSMRVPAVIYADEALILAMDDKVFEQVTNVAMLPGIVKASYAMPDAHWGYGFPIGGVAAFDPDQGGVVSAGGVGFDISCGVRAMLTGLKSSTVEPRKYEVAQALFSAIPAGLGSRGRIRLDAQEMDAMLEGGAEWAVARGYGERADLDRIEERGRVSGARPDWVSDKAKKRQRDEMGTLGSGNHYLEVQEVAEVFERDTATAFGIAPGDVIVSIHCGSRGLGHQIGTEYLRDMVIAAAQYGITLPDRELACAPINSEIGQRYLGAMRAAINCALANREILGQLTRDVLGILFPGVRLELLFDVSHNTCKVEEHEVDGVRRQLYIHRKGATRAFGPGHPDLPPEYRDFGQPVLIGGSMGTASYVLAGTKESETRAFSSACHGAGRAMSRHAALKLWRGRAVMDDLAAHGTIVRSPSERGVAEEAPGAYKDVGAVVDAAHKAGLARKVARLRPIACIKG
ncbi:MAG TPA: RtcB family protein [Alphaproteobacteria bacterium]|jgi:tRNA-splicing ligase RtcB|nr:RtcB family protein [Alphaproteobacteria bacterium]